MALKDLVADHREIAEETIEKIVAAYVRFDPTAGKIIWTPQGNTLSNEARVLVFLVAVLGWQYVVDDPKPVSTKPGDLEGELAIPGGTLRPLLKKLKDTHLLTAVDGNYHAQLANLDSIEAAIAGASPGARARSRTHRSAARAKPVAEEAGKENVGSTAGKRKRGSSGQLKTFLSKWVDDGYFSKAKTLSNLLERYHEHGVITKQTSLSGLMLDAVRNGLLARTKIDVSGKEVWAYTARKARG